MFEHLHLFLDGSNDYEIEGTRDIQQTSSLSSLARKIVELQTQTLTESVSRRRKL